MLDPIVLESVMKDGSAERPGQEQQLPDRSGRFYPITGDELVIVFRDVRTLNVRYMYLSSRG